MGILDSSAKYIWHPFLWPAKDWVNIKKKHICLATQASVDKLYWLSRQSELWTGAISVAVYAPNSDLGPTIAMINYLRGCFPGVLSRTSFHLVYPKNKPSYVTDR